MDTHEWLASRFDDHRAHLRSVAHRMLGSRSEADDAVQEAWLRVSRSGPSGVENLGGWLTTIVARVCLDMLRSRKTRPEEPLETAAPDPLASRDAGLDPEHQVLLADSVGIALLVVLETLEPAERVAFVLHDLFAVPFDEIAIVVGRSPEAARQLASRARRRVQGAPAKPDADRERQREIVDAFLAAARGGDFEALLALLDPSVVLQADGAAQGIGAPKEVLGAQAVAAVMFKGRAHGARRALIDGAAVAVWAPGGKVRAVTRFTIGDGLIVRLDLTAEPAALASLDLTVQDD